MKKRGLSALSLMYQKNAPETIQTLFGTIAPFYDRANAILSFGMHKKWNQALINVFANTPLLLDLCAGTGDIALGFLKKNPHSRAILLDFSPQMLDIAAQKGTSFANRFSLIVGDAQKIPLEEASVDGVSVAYGIRNVKEPETCFDEVYRVLKPGGTFAILELTRPQNPLFRKGHALYLRTLLPLLGKWVAKDKQAYEYLSSSIGQFTSSINLASLLSKRFQIQSIRPMMQGTTTLFVVKKEKK